MHFTTRRFWECYKALPEELQRTADQCYELLKVEPSHPSLHFKKVAKYWSVRAGRDYRALGVEVQHGISWFWIGTHTESMTTRLYSTAMILPSLCALTLVM